jgi:hypothetical protein
MANLKISTYAALLRSLGAVRNAAQSIGSSTSRHAEAHFAHLDMLRKQQETMKAINDGIARSAGKV